MRDQSRRYSPDGRGSAGWRQAGKPCPQPCEYAPRAKRSSGLFFSGKVGGTLSAIGAVVGEFVGADRGLGFLVNLARGLFDTPLMFVALFTLVAIAVSLYAAVTVLESLLLSWKK